MKTKRLFFSSTAIPLQELQAFCENQGIELLAQSLISHKALPFDWDQHEEVIFFSSPRSVEFLLAVFPNACANKSIACVGEGTARFLQEKGIIPDFIGEKAGNTQQVALQFKQWLGSRNVFFPLAKNSLQNISSTVPKNQVSIAFVYETVLNSTKIPACSIYVFTSPSNVRAFLNENTLPIDSTYIAWGKSTKYELEKHGVREIYALENATIAELTGHLKPTKTGEN